MPGTLTISTLSDGTNTSSATDIVNGSARAWVNFIGSSGLIRAGYNVSSVTRNSTGDYTVNFTTPMSDAYFSAHASNMDGGVGYRGYTIYGSAYANNYFRFIVVTTTPTYSDPTTLGVAVFR